MSRAPKAKMKKRIAYCLRVYYLSMAVEVQQRTVLIRWKHLRVVHCLHRNMYCCQHLDIADYQRQWNLMMTHN